MKDGLGEKQVSRREAFKIIGVGLGATMLAGCVPDKFLKKITEETKTKETAERPKNYAKVSYGEGKSCFEATTEAFKLVTGSENEQPISINNATTENPLAKYMFITKDEEKITGVYLFNNHDNLIKFLRDGNQVSNVADEMKDKFGNEGEVMVATGNILELIDEIKAVKDAWEENPNLPVQMVFTESVVTTDSKGRPIVQQGVVNHYKGEGVFQRLEIE